MIVLVIDDKYEHRRERRTKGKRKERIKVASAFACGGIGVSLALALPPYGRASTSSIKHRQWRNLIAFMSVQNNDAVDGTQPITYLTIRP